MVIAVPALIFSSVLYILIETSYKKLDKVEKFNIKYLIYNILFVGSYCAICVFSMPKWVWDANYQVSAFLLVTVIFYIFNYRDRK